MRASSHHRRPPKYGVDNLLAFDNLDAWPEVGRKPLCHHRMQEEIVNKQVQVEEKQITLEEVLAAQPLNPLRPLEFKVLPLYDNQPA